MRTPARGLRDRLLPALLTSAGVTLLAAGLLNYGSPALAGPIGALPSPTSLVLPSTSLPSLPPLETGAPESGPPSASAAVPAVATRIVVDALGIDLPVIIEPNAGYPACNVAMRYVTAGLGEPGEGRSVYLYAHARTGMFLPLLDAVRADGGKRLIGLLVDVYTSDDQRHVYRISAVLPRVPSDSHFLDKALAVRSETLWLQTSTGPGATYPKLQVVARPVGVEPADHGAANPVPAPVSCS